MNYQISEATRLAVQRLPSVEDRAELFASTSARRIYNQVYRFIRIGHNSRDPQAYLRTARAIAAAWETRHPMPFGLGMYELAFASYEDNRSKLSDKTRFRNWMTSDRRQRIAREFFGRGR